MESKMESDLDYEFSPNLPPRGHYSDLGSNGAQKELKGAKNVSKDLQTDEKDLKKDSKS